MRLRPLLFAGLLVATPAPALDWPPGGLLVLCYHDIVDDVRRSLDPTAVASYDLAAQFAWLRGHGYMPVGLDDVLRARRGEKPLPERAVLLTFDDGYRSVYTRAFPLLQAFRYPAVVTLVGRWMDAAPGESVNYGEGIASREAFLSWDEVNVMVRSGLVEVGSQSYDLHHGVPGNPQSNLQPAAATRLYDKASGAYEDDAGFRARLRADLERSAAQIERHTGRRPRSIAWPYGEYGLQAASIAGENGMTIGFSLEDGVNGPDQPLHALKRTIVMGFPSVRDLAIDLAAPQPRAPLRTVRVELDAMYSPDPEEQERRLSTLLNRLEELHINAVFLHAVSDTDGDGAADTAYFPNRRLPMRANLFDRAAWQIFTRARARVYARLPVLAFELASGSREAVLEIYEDLARHAHFQGLAFGVDGDASATEFTTVLAERVRQYRFPLKTARELAMTDGEARTAESLGEYLRHYDWAVRVPPVGTDARGEDPRRLDETLRLLSRVPGALERTVVELFAGDPRSGSYVDAASLAEDMRRLQRAGAIHFGYRSDDFLGQRPALEAVVPAMSLRAYPREKADVR